MSTAQLARRVAAVRRFNRFYTRRIGILNDGLLDSPFSLTEVRVLFELAHAPHLTATALRDELDLDAGYLSRLLRRLEQRGFLTRTSSEADGRVAYLNLTDKGRQEFRTLDERANDEVRALVRELAVPQQRQLLSALRTIEDLLGDQPPARREPYILRTHQPGDMGWVVHRHGVLYAQEYGWDERFEALVAEVVAAFIHRFDPRRERCWIAERDGEIVGSVFLVKKSKTIAQLRLLLVEPSARGLGIGARLVDECIRFGRQCGYRRITLWTNNVLHTARHIYQRAGFQLVREKPHDMFGRDLVGQTWELTL
ncbi:MAG TPA: bifunctional helix-turn-helix transcriptional regulator/GNAT family N-acetyltransferase [Gemmatimonadaceae bacterium]|nr:bifunctional helix-turn-helix transcriptional regulator/GNAT family N-acetyltransferase [Gemmatimonadaceae bacterium]